MSSVLGVYALGVADVLVARIDALQVEYSAWCTDYEDNGLLDTARELGVAIIAFSPLGVGILSGKWVEVSLSKKIC